MYISTKFQKLDQWKSQLIQKAQLKATNIHQVIEWIEYDRFENVEYLAKGGFGTTYKAIWKDGYLNYIENDQLIRRKDDVKGHPVALKCLHNSQDITAEFLREVRYFFIIFNFYS